MDGARIERKRLKELILDEGNANEGTERGDSLLGESVQVHGVGRGILLDKYGRVAAGNKTVVKVGQLGVAEEVIVVHTMGDVLVATQRDDIDLDTPAGRALALADNRVGEINLQWDAALLLAQAEQGVPMQGMWTEEEWAEVLAQAKAGQREPVEDPGPQLDKAEELRKKWGVESGQLWEIPSKTVALRAYVTCPKCGRDVDL